MTNETRTYVDVHTVPGVGKRVTMADLRDFLDHWDNVCVLESGDDVMPVAEFDSQGHMLQIKAQIP